MSPTQSLLKERAVVRRALFSYIVHWEGEDAIDCGIIRLADRPDMKAAAAQWFHEKWGVPLAAYLDSMEACLRGESPVPQWYIAAEAGRIIGGLGVIDNDFHPRKDLTPNVCAVYTEEDRRCEGIAGVLLRFACADMKARGVDTLYLATDHRSFCQRYGWAFFCMTQEEGGPGLLRLYVHREP